MRGFRDRLLEHEVGIALEIVVDGAGLGACVVVIDRGLQGAHGAQIIVGKAAVDEFGEVQERAAPFHLFDAFLGELAQLVIIQKAHAGPGLHAVIPGNAEFRVGPFLVGGGGVEAGKGDPLA